jgi:alpha-galactosidase
VREALIGNREEIGNVACRIKRALLKAALVLFTNMLVPAIPAFAQQLSNGPLKLTVNAQDGSYRLELADKGAVLTSRVGAVIDQAWVSSDKYPKHNVLESTFNDALGSGHAIRITNSGLTGQPDLICVLQLYDDHPYAAIQVTVHNSTARELQVQSIRAIDAVGTPRVDLAGRPSATRVLSDSFSEDWPQLRIYDLGNVPGGMHRGVGSQLLYNRDSKLSLFVGALDSNRFLTIFHLRAEGSGADSKIASFNVDSTGTTEIQKDFDLRHAPPENQVELSLPVAPRTEMSSERLMLQAGSDYRAELLSYGDAIRVLHHGRTPLETPMGWWSWTAYYGGVNEGEVLANADWQAEHLKSLGYKYLQIDEGYQYARGEFATANATQFPSGMHSVGHRIIANGLVFGLWTAPFEVSARAWAYEHHKDWLVHNAKGEPIACGRVWNQDSDKLYILDTTHPGAQEYLRQTYKTFAGDWGVRFIKMDFMDTAAIEGYRYRPHTTALEAQRIGLQIIRDAVGENVLLDKDGSPMLNPVGLVDTGRISADTAHSFEGTKDAAPGIAARFYMHRNFYFNDPDAFNTTAQYFPDLAPLPKSLSLSAAEASIALSAVSGGMYEVGDDLPTVGAQKDRLALLENRELLQMAKLGKASLPLDLMSYQPEDEQPSIFILKESPRVYVLTVFNWTKTPRSHTVRFVDLGLPGEHQFATADILDPEGQVRIENASVVFENQMPESVRMIKLTDQEVPAQAPAITVNVPSRANTGENFVVTADSLASTVPAFQYRWDFGDGVIATGPKVTHTYTRPGQYSIRLTADGADGIPYETSSTVDVSGTLQALPRLTNNRRWAD